jgi:GMP synthase (glutamine-hydrolysing)
VAGPRILVIEGNVAAVRARQVAAQGYDAATGYARVLASLDSGVACTIVQPADAEPRLPAGAGLESFDGAVITGSALNVYDGGPAIERQLEFTRAVLAAGVPLFGSCWGLQIAVTVAGGRVARNPRGREFGFARGIALTEAGREHALYAGKPAVFDAPTVHLDYVEALPAGATVLASNDYGLQAAAFSCGAGEVWAVQYHPEYDYLDVAGVAARYGSRLVTEGLFADEAALAAFIADATALQADPGDEARLERHALGPAMRDATLRRAELRNWLTQLVRPRL